MKTYEKIKLLQKYCIEKKIPLIGVCRGAQIIANYFGSTLSVKEGHVKIEHNINYIQGSSRMVNSYHRYCLLKKDISKLLKI